METKELFGKEEKLKNSALKERETFKRERELTHKVVIKTHDRFIGRELGIFNHLTLLNIDMKFDIHRKLIKALTKLKLYFTKDINYNKRDAKDKYL